MTPKELQQYLTNMKTDLDLVIESKFHPRVHDLLEILINEEVKELITFTERVNAAFDVVLPDVTDNYMKGYLDAINQLKREIYETK